MSTSENSARRRVGGPPLILVASISVTLFAASLIVLNALAGEAYPPPFAEPALIDSYVSSNERLVQFAATLQFASTVPLAIFVATSYSQMRGLGVRVAGVRIALVGGFGATVLGAVAGLVQWTMAASTATETTRATLHTAAFALGGPGYVVFLGLLVAGLAVPALVMRLIPPWLAVTGIVIAATAELSTLALVFNPLHYLLPIGRFGGLAWILAAAVTLPATRGDPRADRPAPRAHEDVA